MIACLHDKWSHEEPITDENVVIDTINNKTHLIYRYVNLKVPMK